MTVKTNNYPLPDQRPIFDQMRPQEQDSNLRAGAHEQHEKETVRPTFAFNDSYQPPSSRFNNKYTG